MGDSWVARPEKSSYTVHFPSALISMSTVKAPPMSRLGVNRWGEEEKQGQSQSRKLFCAIKLSLKSDLYTDSKGKTFISSVCLGGAGGVMLCSGLKPVSAGVDQVVRCVCAQWKVSEGFSSSQCWLKVIPSGSPSWKVSYHHWGPTWAVLAWIRRSNRILRGGRGIKGDSSCSQSISQMSFLSML